MIVFWIFSLYLQQNCIITEKAIPMRKISAIIFMFVVSLVANADNTALFNRLDSVIAGREHYTKEKEQKIDHLKKSVQVTADKQARLKLYDEIYNEYRYFRYDSAMTYVAKGLKLAQEANDSYYKYRNTIHKAMLLSACGLYSEAQNILAQLDETKMDNRLKYEYNLTFYWLYTYWSDYSNNSEYVHEYWDYKLKYLKLTIELAKDSPNDYNYLMGEYHLYITGDKKKAFIYYNKVLRNEPQNSRLYSAAAFAAACCNKEGTLEREKYTILSAITDIITPVKENLSLQELARQLVNSSGNLERAETYINTSMEDAKFYNNRMRIISISNNMPEIAQKYKEMLNKQNKRLSTSLIISILLLFGLVIASLFIVRQNKLLTKRRHEIAENNRQLKSLNEQLSGQNGSLTASNQRMMITNVKREGLAKLYIDLCSKYISRINNYQKLVCRKIKANQVNDLLSTMTSSRLSDEDAATFMHNFDKAFLDQYPTFVSEFNSLLLPEHAIKVKSNSLTTELRIFALVRLGVKESSEIANLLFYTPRTIYNYRSTVKSKAVNKDTFEDDVRNLCKVMD